MRPPGRCARGRRRDDDQRIVERVGRIAEERGVSRAQVAVAWVSRHPAVVAPIVGATEPHHLDDAVASLDLTLTEDEVALLEEPYCPRSVVGFA